jgi:hypothetical protein
VHGELAAQLGDLGMCANYCAAADGKTLEQVWQEDRPELMVSLLALASGRPDSDARRKLVRTLFHCWMVRAVAAVHDPDDEDAIECAKKIEAWPHSASWLDVRAYGALLDTSSPSYAPRDMARAALVHIGLLTWQKYILPNSAKSAHTAAKEAVRYMICTVTPDGGVRPDAEHQLADIIRQHYPQPPRLPSAAEANASF